MRRSTRRLALVAGLAGAVGAAAAVATDRRWRSGADPCGPDPLRLPDGDHRRVVARDGALIDVTVAGDGPTVVLSHCWTGSRATWAPVARRLVDAGCRVVLYDQRGHGESTVGAEGCTLKALGDDLADLVLQLDVRDAVLAGHSLGGMAIQSFVGAHPDLAAQRTSGVVLVATAAAGLGSSVLDGRLATAMASPVVERLLRASFGHALLRGSAGRRPVHTHLVATRDAFVATPPDVRRDFLAAMQSMDLRASLRHFAFPTVVVSGSHDHLTGRLARELADGIPGARQVEWADMGHMLPVEAPDEVADLILGLVPARSELVSR